MPCVLPLPRCSLRSLAALSAPLPFCTCPFIPLTVSRLVPQLHWLSPVPETLPPYFLHLGAASVQTTTIHRRILAAAHATASPPVTPSTATDSAIPLYFRATRTSTSTRAAHRPAITTITTTMIAAKTTYSARTQMPTTHPKCIRPGVATTMNLPGIQTSIPVPSSSSCARTFPVRCMTIHPLEIRGL